MKCEICEKRESTQTLKVCDCCYNDMIKGIDEIIEDVENEQMQEL
jgi:hypothetical protein